MLKIKTIQFYILIIGLITIFSFTNTTTEILDQAKIASITSRYEKILADSKDSSLLPRTIKQDGSLVSVDVYDWTSGFFPGNLWYIFELTGDKKWADAAAKWTEKLDTIQYYSGHHDIGFMINCSYGNGLRLMKNEKYKQVLVNAAKSLCKRYNDTTKCIKSWNRKIARDGKTEWFYPVIIDNMMNLELLFEATLLSGDKRYAEIAVTHANTTMKNHFRPDFSSYHVVDYDTLTGQVKDKATYQGFADNSSWARGQAWGLYGFTTCYRYTKNTVYLDFAEKIANYIITHPNLPEDKIPYWDYNINDTGFVPEWKYDASKYPEILRDASAAAITASALLELSAYSANKGNEYKEFALKIIQSLSSQEYFANDVKNQYFILNHSVGNFPGNSEIDVPLVYADYYFLEAVLRSIRLLKAH